MIIVLESHQSDVHKHILDDMFRLRARVFSEKLGWDVKVVDGQERDCYDDLNPVYIINLDENKNVVASLRLLPTTGRTLLSDIFYETAPDAASLAAPGIWECSRFCIDEDRLATISGREVRRTSAMMLASIAELGLLRGIEAIVGNCEPAALLAFRRSGVDVDVIGQTDKFGTKPVYLGLFDVRPDVYTTICGRAGVEGPVISSLDGALASRVAA